MERDTDSPTSAPPPDVKVIFSASGGSPRVAVETPAAREARGGWGVLLLALLQFGFAISVTYLAWNPVNRHLFASAIMKTPLAIDRSHIEALSAYFRRAQEEAGDRQVPPRDPTPIAEAAPEPLPGPVRQALIWGSLHLWLAALSGSACFLMLSGGACLSNAFAGRTRACGILLVIVGLAGVVVGGAATAIVYGRGFPTWTVQAGVAVLMLLALGIGLLAARRHGGLLCWAGLSVIAAALVTTAGVYAWSRSGIFPAEYLPESLLARLSIGPDQPAASGLLLLSFAIHSLLGWILLAAGLSRRARRRRASA